uniref:Uncharacterized protein n=1 Tax=Auxenochlorella protothecoides TaxID=3075 RepID=A0A1D2A8V5_AUXPR
MRSLRRCCVNAGRASGKRARLAHARPTCPCPSTPPARHRPRPTHLLTLRQWRRGSSCRASSSRLGTVPLQMTSTLCRPGKASTAQPSWPSWTRPTRARLRTWGQGPTAAARRIHRASSRVSRHRALRPRRSGRSAGSGRRPCRRRLSRACRRPSPASSPGGFPARSSACTSNWRRSVSVPSEARCPLRSPAQSRKLSSCRPRSAPSVAATAPVETVQSASAKLASRWTRLGAQARRMGSTLAASTPGARRRSVRSASTRGGGGSRVSRPAGSSRVSARSPAPLAARTRRSALALSSGVWQMSSSSKRSRCRSRAAMAADPRLFASRRQLARRSLRREGNESSMAQALLSVLWSAPV